MLNRPGHSPVFFGRCGIVPSNATIVSSELTSTAVGLAIHTVRPDKERVVLPPQAPNDGRTMVVFINVARRAIVGVHNDCCPLPIHEWVVEVLVVEVW